MHLLCCPHVALRLGEGAEGRRRIVALAVGHLGAARSILEPHPESVERVALATRIGRLERQYIGDAGAFQHLPHGVRQIVEIAIELAVRLARQQEQSVLASPRER